MALQLDQELLQAALVGYQKQLEDLQGKMADLKRRLGQGGGSAAAAPRKTASAPAKQSGQRQHRMSEEGRARIAAAQRARWAKVKKTKKSDE